MERVDFKFLKQLYLFSVVVKTGNISKAAKLLSFSQPPLSFQLKQLEETLGYELFERGAKGVKLTNAAENIIPVVNDFVARAELVCYSLKDKALKSNQILLIGSVYDGMVNLIPRIKDRVKDQLEQTEIFCAEMDSAELPQKVENEEIHAGIGYITFCKNPNLLVDPLHRQKMVVIFPLNHAFNSLEVIPWSLLNDEPLVLVPRENSPEYADHLISLFLKHKVSPKVTHLVVSILRQIAFVSCNNLKVQ